MNLILLTTKLDFVRLLGLRIRISSVRELHYAEHSVPSWACGMPAELALWNLMQYTIAASCRLWFREGDNIVCPKGNGVRRIYFIWPTTLSNSTRYLSCLNSYTSGLVWQDKPSNSYSYLGTSHSSSMRQRNIEQQRTRFNYERGFSMIQYPALVWWQR